MFSDRKKTYDWKKSEENSHRYKCKPKNKNTEKQEEEENVSCGQNFGCQCIGYIKAKKFNFFKKVHVNFRA